MTVLEAALRRDRLVLLAALALLFALSALYTISGVGMRMSALEMTSMASMRDMPGKAVPGAWSAAYAALVFLMWWVMMVAMMLPSVAPNVLLFAALVRRTRDAGRAGAMAGCFLAGYLLAWAGFALVAAAAQWALEAAGIVSATMMTLVDTLPGALVLIAAGIFQFTPLKGACLSHCRAPTQFLARHYRPGPVGAVRMGLHHGTYCVGCCWFLMALLFVGGVMNLYWIVGLTAFVALEKLTPAGAALSRIAGAGLVAWGVWVILSGL
ncbi:DUF2182 domain-containing protein [Acuticoccus sediminis]|uniref:DUF2182 domain-containing protein n=1 Tax=Acuticoccus sediminis TaxID=2184697 RepID=UPI001FD32967|nr:DUF2182 domain-containing protein [Acuticoccus sediminis]